MPSERELFQQRLDKRARLLEAGDPYPARVTRTHTAAEAVTAFVDAGEPEGTTEVSVVGRVTAQRMMGKAAFLDVRDATGRIQLHFRRDHLDNFESLALVDLGDFLEVGGTLFRTRTGEVTVAVTAWRVITKTLLPLPDQWAGLKDPETRARQRYLDLLANERSMVIATQRSQIVSAVRRFFLNRGFLEVETPVLQDQAGGAAARPFTTHHNALDRDFFLRISLELHLKRLLVGGFEKVFEIGRVFRNEGVSVKHSPEFTMLEAYQAYTDYRGMMELVRSMIQKVCAEVLGTTTVVRPDGVAIELGGEWREAKYKDLILERTGDPQWFARTKEEKIAACKVLGLHEPRIDWEDFEVTNEVFGKLIEPGLIQPTFVTHIPKELCPLAKVTLGDDSTIDVFELCINGQEIAPAYSEQNDPGVQRQMLQLQAGAETQKIDEDFLLALEHGMPPAGGLGIGIDRLVILLTGAANIRDVILFPTLAPEASA